MPRHLPITAILLGVLGLVPFIVAGLLALSPDAAQARAASVALVGYGGVILAFLGGVHWGFALDAPEPASPSLQRARLVLGVLPALVGWLALLALLLLPLWCALLLLIAGFLATVIVEHRAAAGGFVPRPYLWMRWGLTLVVAAMLVTVLTIRLLGQTINM